MKNVLHNRLRPFILVLMVGVLCAAFFGLGMGGGLAGGAIGPEQCCACHREVCEDTASKRYVHAPVREKQCALCHIASTGADRMTVAKKEESTVRWLPGGYPRQEMECWFSIPPALAGKKIILQADGQGKKTLRQEVQLPKFLEAEQLTAVTKPPEITDLTVDEVKQGVFLTARVTWKTDRVTDSAVLYGENEATRKNIVDPWLSKDHEVLLTDLQPRKTYTFSVVSRDIFGNQKVSPAKTFSTHAFFSKPSIEKAKNTEKVTVSGKYFRVDNRFFARFVANQPTSMRLGTLDGTMPASSKDSGLQSGKLPPEHLPLTDPRFLNTGVCLTCHPQAKGVLSHPVDVKPKRGMIIDTREYKILGDGRLTCMTCHVPHASDNETRLVKNDKKKLCLGCHKNFG